LPIKQNRISNMLADLLAGVHLSVSSDQVVVCHSLASVSFITELASCLLSYCILVGEESFTLSASFQAIWKWALPSSGSFVDIPFFTPILAHPTP